MASKSKAKSPPPSKGSRARPSARSTPRVDLGLDSFIPLFEEREKARDALITASRPLVRRCALAIKMLHNNEVPSARAELDALASEMDALPPHDASYDYLFEPIWQEMVEARLLLAAVERRPLPTAQALDVPPEVYLLGLCDAVGEFRRALLESLRHAKNDDARYYFDLMTQIYDQLSVIRFSNSLLPNFKPKQDQARHALEMARSEILRANP